MKLGLINFIAEIKFLLDSYLCTQLFSTQIASGTKMRTPLYNGMIISPKCYFSIIY